MRRALRRAVGVLVAAAALGAARPAPAQVSPDRSTWRAVPDPAARYPETVDLTEARCRLEEMKVELAWLTDPVTSPYYLGARAGNGNMVLRGYVPDRVVKQRAVELTRQHTSLIVVDTLGLHPNLP